MKTFYTQLFSHKQIKSMNKKDTGIKRFSLCQFIHPLQYIWGDILPMNASVSSQQNSEVHYTQ